jgi:NAD(P)-dependent dehydrogenase (short-subunit alcohol dehydrogenase family)
MRTILITGANGNLGSVTVKKFSDEGWKVIAVVSPRADSNLFAGLSHVEIIKTDAAREQEVTAAMEPIMSKHDPLDAAVLTIGGYVGSTLEETTASQVQEMMQLNFFTALHFAKPLFMKMTAVKKGHIVLIGSQTGINLTKGADAVAYSIAKTAVAKLAALLNETGKKKNVYCTLVSPAVLDTPQNRKAMPHADFSHWQKPETVAAEIYKIING